MVKYELLNQVFRSSASIQRACQILGLNPERLYRWKKLYDKLGLFGLADKLPMAVCVPHCLLPEEKDQILRYANGHPEQHHREIQFNLARHEIASVSASSVYRTLKAKKLVKEHRVLKPKKVYTRPEATSPHQHWLLDLTYILVGKTFWYLIAIIDLYSRYVVGWELSPSSTARDVERVIDFTLAEWDLHDTEEKPIIHQDNGPQMRAKSLKKFLRDIGVLNEYSRPHTPQDQAIIERLFRTTKQEEVYRQEYTDHLDARDSLSRFFDYYNNRRPHQGIENVTPYDKLMGLDVDIIQMRKIKNLMAQTRRKLVNRSRKFKPEPKEFTPEVYTFNSEKFLQRV